jgi:L-cysteine S-thiosulfotransferase
MMRSRLLAIFALLATPVAAGDGRPAPLRSGHEFQSVETQRMEADEGTNPGMLWVEQGAMEWSKVEGPAGKSCASCHQDPAAAMKGVATHYPMVDAPSGSLLNLEGRINQCRVQRMQAKALEYESNELLGLTAFVTAQSRGMPRSVVVDGPAKPFFEAGRAFYETREGQLNLSCGQCHNDNWGKRLRGDVISQGQTDGWPAYRLEWQTMASLHRRLRACSFGVRAEVLDYGAPEYVALELYLAWRGEGLPITSPGVRR